MVVWSFVFCGSGSFQSQTPRYFSKTSQFTARRTSEAPHLHPSSLYRIVNKGTLGKPVYIASCRTFWSEVGLHTPAPKVCSNEDSYDSQSSLAPAILTKCQHGKKGNSILLYYENMCSLADTPVGSHGLPRSLGLTVRATACRNMWYYNNVSYFRVTLLCAKACMYQAFAHLSYKLENVSLKNSIF